VCDLGNSGVWDRDYGWGVRVRRPFGARGMSSVRYGTRLGDLKNKQPTHTLGLWFFLTLFRIVTSSSEKHRNRSSSVTAGAAGGLAVQGAVAVPAEIVAHAVASPGEETPAAADMYSSPAQKFWCDRDTCRMIVAACSDRLRPFLDKLGTQPNRLESELSSASCKQPAAARRPVFHCSRE